MLKSIVVALVTAAVVLAGTAVLRAEPVPSKAKWEYRIVGIVPGSGGAAEEQWTRLLNGLAADGWEYDGAFRDNFFVTRRPAK